MVSGGQVLADSNSFQQYLKDYSDQITNLSGVWKGASYNNLASKAETFVSECSGGISGQMQSFASACDLYQEYVNTKSALSAARNGSDNEGEIASYQSRLANLKNQIESLLSSASSFQYASSTGSSSLSMLGTPSYGSFEKYNYTASNGVNIEYYLYVPNYGGTAANLPIHLYFHGSGETGSGVLKCGLPKLINEQSINPAGLVFCIQAKNGKQFYDSKYLTGVLELAKKVGSENGGDPNRISVSGHSMGAVAGYQIISDHPNDFTAFIPISGFARHTEKLTNVKTWAFHGAKDTTCDYNYAVATIRKLQNLGAFARLHTYSSAGHGGVQNTTFQKEFEDENGEMINPLDWAFKQTKETVSL